MLALAFSAKHALKSSIDGGEHARAGGAAWGEPGGDPRTPRRNWDGLGDDLDGFRRLVGAYGLSAESEERMCDVTH
jgi:hypothetical protein